MINVWKRVLAAGLMAGVLCAVFTGCAGDPAKPGDGTASSSGSDGFALTDAGQGRYRETQLNLPGEAAGVMAMHAVAGGALGVVTADAQGVPGYYEYQDGVPVQTEKPWVPALAEMGTALGDVSFDADGNPWALVRDQSGEESVSRVVRWDGTAFEEIPLGEKDAEAYGVNPLPDGSFLAEGPGILYHFEPDGSLRATYDAYARGTGAVGGALAVADSGSETVRFFSMADGAETARIPFAESSGAGSALAAGSDGKFYFANGAGIFDCAPETEAMRAVVDGSFYRMASSSLTMTGIVPAEGGVFYVSYYEIQEDQTGLPLLMEYRWDGQLDARPAKTLRVASLYGGEAAREAAVQLQLGDPELRVELETAFDAETGGSLRDAIRTINTEILADRGADVYILDDMPLDSYIEKGILMDLSDLAKPRMESGEWLKNIAGGLEWDGKMYAIPTRFGIPAVWGPADTVGKMTQLANLADYAESSPEIPVFYRMHPKNILEMLYPVCSPGWRQRDGTIEQKAFGDYLAQAGRIAATDPDKEYMGKGNGLDGSAEIPAFLLGLNQVIAQEILHTSMLTEALSALAQRGGGVLAPMPGQAGNVFVPHVIVGVNARTGVPDEARAYVETLLSAPVQRMQSVNYEGLPVHTETLISQLDGLMEKEEPEGAMQTFTSMIGYGFDEAPDGMVTLAVDKGLDTATREAFLKMCETASGASMPDPVLLDMITEETQGYFEGQGALEQAVQAVAARTKAYLTE